MTAFVALFVPLLVALAFFYVLMLIVEFLARIPGIFSDES